MDLSSKPIRTIISPYGTRRATAIQEIASIPVTVPDGAAQVNKYISLKACRSILKELMSTEHRSYATPFYKPRRSTDAVYYDIVKRPMDLGTVKAKFDRRLYLCSDDFVEDIRLVFSNTYAVHKSPEDETFLSAKKLEKVFEALLVSAPQEAISNWNDQLQALRKEVAACEAGSRQLSNTKRAIKELELNLFGAKGVFKKPQAPKEVKTNADIATRLHEMRQEVGSLKEEILQLEKTSEEAEVIVDNRNMKRKMSPVPEEQEVMHLNSNLIPYEETIDLSNHVEEAACQPKKPLKEVEVKPPCKVGRPKKTPITGTVITDGLTTILKLNREANPKEPKKKLAANSKAPSANEENKENMMIDPPVGKKGLQKGTRKPLTQIQNPKADISMLKSSTKKAPVKKSTKFHLKPLHLKEALVHAGSPPKKQMLATSQRPTDLSDSSSDESDSNSDGGTIEEGVKAKPNVKSKPPRKDSQWLDWFLSLQNEAQLSESSSDSSSGSSSGSSSDGSSDSSSDSSSECSSDDKDENPLRHDIQAVM